MEVVVVRGGGPVAVVGRCGDVDRAGLESGMNERIAVHGGLRCNRGECQLGFVLVKFDLKLFRHLKTITDL